MRPPKTASIVLSFVFAALIATPAAAGEHRVKPDGTGDFATIQDAIDASIPGDTIILLPGVFIGTGNKNLDTGGKAITITSSAGADQSIIDCETDGRAFYIHSGEGNDTAIREITIVNGEAATLDGRGGAIYCGDASPTILECVFQACYADSGAALCLIRSQAKIVRNRFIDNNCFLGCVGPDPPWFQDTVGAIYCVASDVEIVDNYFHKNQSGIFGLGAVLWARHSTVLLAGNDFHANGQVQGGGPVYIDSCQVEIVGNYFHGNSGERNGSVSVNRSTGVVRANRIQDNNPHCITGGVSAGLSNLQIDFNLITDNGGLGIYVTEFSGLVYKNIIARGGAICFEEGRGIVLRDSPSAVVTNNVFYKNCADGIGRPGTELTYALTVPVIESNILVNYLSDAMVACDATPPPFTFSSATIDSIFETRNFFWGDYFAWYYSHLYGCVDQGYFDDPRFRDPDNDNWFLRPGSRCVVDTTYYIGEDTLYVNGFAGALPIAVGTSDALSTTVPPDHIVSSPVAGDVYLLSGFSVTNISDREAPVYYELMFGGDAIPHDQGDPLAFVGVTPILQPGESFTPPEAALIVPNIPGASVATVTYLAAYAPALNMPDTIVTTISFDSPTPVEEHPVIGLSLNQNVPNPFNPTTTISYSLPTRQRVLLSVFDVRGRRVATLADGVEAPGPHAVEWDGRSARGVVQSSGVYFYRLQAGPHVLTRKMILMK